MNESSQAAARAYLEPLRREAVRTLSLLDREPYSPTRGCMDRTHWAWKFTDFPGARFQEGLCLLSFLYATPFEGNPYRGSPRLLNWIAAGFEYWAGIQYADGAFDEAYPFERSLAATAFTSFYLCEARELLGSDLPPAADDRFKRALSRAGEWLERNDEKHGFLTNHLAAAAAALQHIFRVTGQARFEQRGRHFLERILDHQSAEGWYDEYGGADPGYQTHGSFYLARYLELSGDRRLVPSLDQATRFLAHFVHPDGSLGGEYASRNTQFYYPAAFEMLSTSSGSATWIAETMLPSVESLAAAGGGTMDAYNYFPLLNNYVFAYLACRREGHRSAPAAPPSVEAAGSVHFPGAGLLKKRTSRYELIVGTQKGGVIKAFDLASGRLLLSDCGYIGRLKSGSLISSQSQSAGREVTVNDDEVVVEGRFYGFKKPVMKPFSFLLFRGFSLTFGRIGKVSYWLKSLLVKALIYRRNEVALEFRRTIRFAEESFTVRDRIRGEAGGGVESLQRAGTFTTIHMGSSKYFLPNELDDSATDETGLDPGRLQDGITLERTVSAG